MAESEIEELKAVLSARSANGSFAGVWPENHAAVDAFLAVASQWRTAVTMEKGRLTTMWIGLDYAGAAIGWGARGIEMTNDLLTGVQIMEMAARAALNGDALNGDFKQ